MRTVYDRCIHARSPPYSHRGSLTPALIGLLVVLHPPYICVYDMSIYSVCKVCDYIYSTLYSSTI